MIYEIYEISIFVLELKICCKFRSWLVLTWHCPPSQEMVVIRVEISNADDKWSPHWHLWLGDIHLNPCLNCCHCSCKDVEEEQLHYFAVIGLVKMLKRNTAPFILLHGGLWRQFVSSFVGASFGRSPMARPLLLSEENPSSFVYLPYYGVQNIILETKTLFWRQEHIILGTEILFWGPEHHFWNQTTTG